MSYIFTTFHVNRSWHLWMWWDNHPSCLSCFPCSGLLTCSTCSLLSEKIWVLAEKRLTYSARKYTMRKKKLNKTCCRIRCVWRQLSFRWEHHPTGLYCQGKTHWGGNCMTLSLSSLGTSHQSQLHQAPGNHRALSNQSLGYFSLGYQAPDNQAQGKISLSCAWWNFADIRHRSPVNQSPVSLQWLPGNGYNHQAPVIGQPITGHQSTYQAPVIRHLSIRFEYRVTNQTHRSSEHSISNEPQNSATSKRILLPLGRIQVL